MTTNDQPKLEVHTDADFTLVDLSAVEQALIKRHYAGYHLVRLDWRPRGSYRGTQVFLVSLKGKDGWEAPQVVKFGVPADLEAEFTRYKRFFQKILPRTAAPINTGPTVRDDHDALIAYTAVTGYADDSISPEEQSPVRSLADEFLARPGNQVEALINRLFGQKLIPHWKKNSNQPDWIDKNTTLYFGHVYGAILPDLSLTDVTVSDDDLPPATVDIVLKPAHQRSDCQRLEVGQTVQLNRLTLLRQYDDRLELLFDASGKNVPLVVKIKFADKAAATVKFDPGHPLWLRGRVEQVRGQRLAEQVQRAFDGEIDPTAKRVTFAGRDWLNPLLHFETYLNEEIKDRASFAVIHGDLHANNIMVDDDNPWLIDFADAGHGYVLFDLIKLETSLRMLLHHKTQPELALIEIVALEQRLLAAQGHKHRQVVPPPQATPLVEKVVAVIDQLRVHAGELHAGRDFRANYLKALFLYLVATLKYDNNPPTVLRHHFAAAALVLTYLTGEYKPDRAFSQTRLQHPGIRGANVPPLPTHLVERPEITDQIRARLLRTDATRPGIMVISAIHGMGGIGKSVLATVLAYDPEIQQRFPDGILWKTLGQEPDLLTLLTELIRDLGDYHYQPTSKAAAGAHLRTLLADKTVLLMVDDVWEKAHAQAFNLVTPRSQILITTRQAAIATLLNAALYRLDVLTEPQALSLLEKHIERTFDADEKREAAALAGQVDYLPQALHLAAIQQHDYGLSWAALRREHRETMDVLDIPGWEGETNEEDRKQMSLRVSFMMSLRRLPAEQLAQFAWLGVIAEDARLTPALAQTLWQLKPIQARQRLQYFFDRGLLLPAEPLPDGTPSFRQHDHLRQLAQDLLQAPVGPTQARHLPSLGLTLEEAHHQLLERYQALTKNGQWHTLPDDGYIHRHLTWHFEQAGQPDLNHALLQEETEAGHNGWYAAWERLGQTGGFAADVNRAWQQADRLWNQAQTEAERATAVGHQIRCALITASLSSLSRNIPPELIAQLVKTGNWSPAQGLAYIRLVTDPSQKVRGFVVLVPHLPPPLLDEVWIEALAAVREISEEKSRSEALAALAPFLSPPLLTEIWTQALTSVRDVCSERDRLEALAAIAPLLRQQRLAIVLAARDVGNEWDRSEALAALAPHLPPPLLAEAVTIAQEIDNEWDRSEALAALAPHLPPPLLAEAVAAVREIFYDDLRLEALVSLAPHLPPLMLADALADALATARYIDNGWYTIKTLADLGPYLSPPLLAEAVTIAQEIGNEWYRSEALAALAPHLPPPLLAEAVAAVRNIGHEEYRSKALAGLAPHLPLSLLTEALAIAREIDEWKRARALISLAPHLPPPLLAEALAAARDIDHESFKSEAVAGLAPHLPQQLLNKFWAEVLAAAKVVRDARSRSEAMIVVAPYLPLPLQADTWAEALAATHDIDDARDRSKALVALAPHLPQRLLAETLASARDSGYEAFKSEVLTGLAPHLPQRLLAEAVAIVRNIGDEEYRSKALAGLVPHLPPPLLAKAVIVAREIDDAGYRSKALATVAPHLPLLQAEVWAEALAAAREIRSAGSRSRALADLALHLPKPLLAKAVIAAGEIDDAIDGVRYRSEALAGLVPHLPPSLLAEALATAREFRSGRYRSKALAAFTPYLPQRLLAQAVAVVRNIGDEEYRSEVLIDLTLHLPSPLLVEALALLAPHIPQRLLAEAMATASNISEKMTWSDAVVALAPHLPSPLLVEALTLLAPHLPQHLLAEVLAIAREFRDEWYRSKALAALAPHLPPPLLAEALAAAQEIGNERHRSKALAALAPHLPPSLLAEALATAREIGDEWYRSEALAGLAPYLPPPLLVEAVTTARKIDNARCRSEALAALARYLQLLQAEVWAEALAAAREIGDEWARADALAALAPHLPPPLLTEAVAAAREIGGAWYHRSRALVGLEPHLPQPRLAEALAAAREIRNEGGRSEALAALAPHLPPSLLAEALAAVREIRNEWYRSKALAALAPHLPPPLLAEALAAARKIDNARCRSEALAALAPHLSELSFATLEREWPVSLRELAWRSRPHLLSDIRALLPLIKHLGGQLTVVKTVRAIVEVGRWWP